jgi:ribokinase
MVRMLLVFGSINVDLVLRCATLPREGQTLLAEHSLLAAGGKGANQAHAAALAGADVALVGAVGQDALADVALAGLEQADVDLDGVARVPALTGCASVALGANGANQIIVASGANANAQAAQVTDAKLRASRMLLMQMELPLGETVAMLHRAKAYGLQTVVNNAPATALSLDTLRLIDLLILNQHEFADTLQSLGMPAPTSKDFSQAIAALALATKNSVVVTLGEHGCAAMHDGKRLQAKAPKVRVVDTTGAGDTFCGALCAALLRGQTFPMALQSANHAAAQACTWLGAQKPLT